MKIKSSEGIRMLRKFGEVKKVYEVKRGTI